MAREQASAVAPAPPRPSVNIASAPSISGPKPVVWDDGTQLDELSNSVIDLIHQRRFDDALAACEALRRDYPEVVDGFERAALVHEARGDWTLAADSWRRALAFVERPEQRDGFDVDLIADFRAHLANAEVRALAQ